MSRKRLSRATRRKISIGSRRSKRDIFKKSPGGQRSSILVQIKRELLDKPVKSQWRYVGKRKKIL